MIKVPTMRENARLARHVRNQIHLTDVWTAYPPFNLVWCRISCAPTKRPFSKLSLSLYLLPFGQPGASATRLWQQHRPVQFVPLSKDVGPSSANGPRSDVTHLPKRAPTWVDRTWSNVEGFQGNIVRGRITRFIKGLHASSFGEEPRPRNTAASALWCGVSTLSNWLDFASWRWKHLHSSHIKCIFLVANDPCTITRKHLVLPIYTVTCTVGFQDFRVWKLVFWFFVE